MIGFCKQFYAILTKNYYAKILQKNGQNFSKKFAFKLSDNCSLLVVQTDNCT